jgi:hypothetical protein
MLRRCSIISATRWQLWEALGWDYHFARTALYHAGRITARVLISVEERRGEAVGDRVPEGVRRAGAPAGASMLPGRRYSVSWRRSSARCAESHSALGPASIAATAV